MNTLTYQKNYCVLWGVRESQPYLMHRALELMRRMRARGKGVTLCIIPRGLLRTPVRGAIRLELPQL